MSDGVVDRRDFLKMIAVLAGAVAAGPEVIAYLEEAGAARAVASDQISYADFVNAVAYLEQHNQPGPYYMVMPPWLYADLMESFDEYLRDEFGKQMPMNDMMLKEISPGQAEYVNTKTGKSLGAIIVYGDTIPEDEALIEWTVINEDATLTIGVEAT